MAPKLSVIIPTKNRVEITIRCIESIINQTFTPDEIITVDAIDTEILNSEIKNNWFIFNNARVINYILTRPHFGCIFSHEFKNNFKKHAPFKM